MAHVSAEICDGFFDVSELLTHFSVKTVSLLDQIANYVVAEMSLVFLLQRDGFGDFAVDTVHGFVELFVSDCVWSVVMMALTLFLFRAFVVSFLLLILLLWELGNRRFQIRDFDKQLILIRHN